MIQQISYSAPQQSPQYQAAQQSDTGTFESLMKTSVTKLNQGSTDKAPADKAQPDDKKDSDQKTGSTNVPTALSSADTASLAALLQQTSVQPVIVIAQAGNMQASNAAQTVNVAQTAVAAPQAANASQTAGVQQAANSLQGQQSNPVAASENAARVQTANPAVQQNAATQQSDVKSTQTQSAPQTGNIQLTSAMQTDGTAQAVQNNQGGTSSALTQTGIEPKQNANDTSILDFTAQIQDASLAEKKSSLLDDSTASQNQSATTFSDLYRTGNVVIQVSDKAANVAKAACGQVAENITENLRAGNSKFQIDLYPQDLGKVSVKLAVQNGLLTVELSAANPKTQSMLMSNTSEIKSMLQSTVNQPVQVLQPSQDKAWYQQPQDQSNQSSAQQQQQQDNRETKVVFNTQDSDSSTADFLSVMQQLKQ